MCVNISIPPQIVYASYVCNVVKYATISPARPGCVLLKFAHRPTLLHRSNTNIEYFIKMATQAEFYLCYPQSALMISGHCFLIKTLSLKIPPDTAVSMVTLLLSRPCGAIRDCCYQEVFRRSQSFYRHMLGIRL